MIILKTNSIKEKILNNVKKEIKKLNHSISLVTISIGDNKEHNSYLKSIDNMCNTINCKHQNYHYKEIKEEELLKLINKLNKNNKVTSILLCLPFPKYLNKDKIINAIDHNKDVDCLTNMNLNKLYNQDYSILPSTVSGIMNLLNQYNIKLKSKNILIINRSNLIGKPLASILMDNDATVTIAHSKTTNLDQYLKLADIVITAVGKANFITSDKVKEKAVIIDVGLSYYDGKLTGDFKITIDKEIYITSVPGGIGNMTIASLAENILKCYYLNHKK